MAKKLKTLVSEETKLETEVETKQACLTEKELIFFYEIDKRIQELQNKKIEQAKKIMLKSGPTSGHLRIDGLEKPYVRVKLKDNANAFSMDECAYRTARFSRYEVEISALKNEPKD